MRAQVIGEQALTFEEAARMDPDEAAGEVVRGRWVPGTRNTWHHGTIVVRIAARLLAYAESHPGWSVSAGDPGTKLAREPDTLRGPDVAMVRAERVPAGRGADGWLAGAPDLAVEVAGDAQSVGELTQKAIEYLQAGAQMVWVVDGEARRVLVFTPPDHVRVLGEDDAIGGGAVLPGFRCAVADLIG